MNIRFLFAALVCALALGSCGGNARTELFNGKDLAGWVCVVDSLGDVPAGEVFTVRDGNIRIAGQPFGYMRTARQYGVTRLDYARYDHLIGMDESNLCDILRLVGGDPQHKVSLLMAHTDHPREVADPWFTGDFEATWQDILEGCTALLEELR